jgi:hypothetical protein
VRDFKGEVSRDSRERPVDMKGDDEAVGEDIFAHMLSGGLLIVGCQEILSWPRAGLLTPYP